MLLSEEKLDVTQISLTGTRALVLIGLLILAPQSFDEIKSKFIEMGLFDEKSSVDILRIDIGTIKSMGCEISRPCQSNGFKYVLQKHPFSLTLSSDDVKLFKRAYNKLKNTLTLEIIFEYDNLFKKIAEHIYDEKIKEEILGISVLKHYDIQSLKEIFSDCETQKILELVYRNQETKKEGVKKIKAQRLVFQNDKIYLYGYDIEKEYSTILLYKRIKKIISKTDDKTIIKPKNFLIKYKLKNIVQEILSKDEKIIQQDNNTIIVEGTFYNDFLATQKILSYGLKCTVLEPIEFKNSIIEKLKEMKEVYNG